MLKPFLDRVLASLSVRERNALAVAYVEADGTSRRLLAQHAYSRLPKAKRKALHLARASSLAALKEPSLSLGAIPFHHEQAGDDAQTLLAASLYCLKKAYYHAALDWSARGRWMKVAASHGKTYGDLTRNMFFALLLLGRYDEVERLCADILAADENSELLAHATYAMAILNARLYERSRQDYDAARTWIEKSRTFTEGLPPSPMREVNAAFLMNTLALVEMRKGRVDLAEQKLLEAIDYMARAAPERYRAESAILWHNMARLHIATGQPDRAIQDLTILLTQEPSESGAWFDRALIHQRAGRYEAALSDYDMAIRWGPPHVESTFNRAQTLTALGRHNEALAAYDYVVILDPDFIDARINRACLLRERGDYARAREDVAYALLLRPTDARLLCLRGLLSMQDGKLEEAFDLFTSAIAADPTLADSWANRAIISFRRNDCAAALEDLTKALALRDDAAVLYNRGRVFESLRQWAKAAEDYERALTLASGDVAHIVRHLNRCREAMQDVKGRSANRKAEDKAVETAPSVDITQTTISSAGSEPS